MGHPARADDAHGFLAEPCVSVSGGGPGGLPSPMSAEPGISADLARARDELFTDADRHGPRARELSIRAGAAVAVVPATIGISTWIAEHVRSANDLSVIVPSLAGFIAAGLLLAPLARMRMGLLIAIAVACLLPMAWLVLLGELVLAAPLGAFGALVFGLAAARLVYRAVWALPILLVAGISDAHSVQGGLTNALLAGEGGGPAGRAVTSVAPSAVQTIDFLVVHVPAHSDLWVLGLVDLLAIGLLLGLAHLYWQAIPRTALALLAALLVTCAFDTPVPVIPALGIAWTLANWRLVWRSTRFSLRRLTYLGG